MKLITITKVIGIGTIALIIAGCGGGGSSTPPSDGGGTNPPVDQPGQSPEISYTVPLGTHEISLPYAQNIIVDNGCGRIDIYNANTGDSYDDNETLPEGEYKVELRGMHGYRDSLSIIYYEELNFPISTLPLSQEIALEPRIALLYKIEVNGQQTYHINATHFGISLNIYNQNFKKIYKGSMLTSKDIILEDGTYYLTMNSSSCKYDTKVFFNLL